MILLAIRSLFSESSTGSIFLALLGVLSIALGVVLAISSETGPSATAFWRFVFGGAGCAALSCAVLGGGVWAELHKVLGRPEMWVAGISFALSMAFWYSGMRISSVATTSTFHNMSPLLLAVVAWFVFGMRPSRQVLAGLAVALIGAALLAFQSGGLEDQTLEGDLLALISAGFLAVFYTCLTRLSRDCHPWIIMTVVSFISAVILLAIAVASEDVLVPQSRFGWSIVIALGLVTQVLGQSLMGWASKRLGAFGICSITLTEPALSALMAAFLIAAPLHGPHLIGMALTATGLFVILEHRHRVRSEPAPRLCPNEV